MKKILSIALAAIMLLTVVGMFASCGKKSDYKQIEEKGYFVCGITLYEPMNFFNEDDELTGFDTDFANAVAEKLGLQAKFQVISWGSKYLELNSGAIDCIWNGFTYGSETVKNAAGEEISVSRTDYVDFSYKYLANGQCVVTSTANLVTLNSKEAFAGKKGMAEGGSAGEELAQELSTNYTATDSQAKALIELKNGTVDFIVIDSTMANAMVGKGDYAALSVNNAIPTEAEEYAIGFRKGSDFTAKVNEAIKELSADGTLAAIAAKYDLSSDLIANIGK